MSEKLNTLVKDITPPFIFRIMRSVLFPGNASAEKSGEWYDGIYENSSAYQKHYTESVYYFLWAVILDRMVHSGAKRILDLGCGTGQFASLVHDKGFRQYCGVDISPKAIEIARKKCPDFEFIAADAFETDVLTARDYDCFVACEFLEHVNQELEILKKVKPGVRFLGSVPNNPHVSHVRYFANEDDVRARYGFLFKNLRVDTFHRDQEGLLFYVIDGIKI